MPPPSIHFELSIPQDEYNFGTLGATLTPLGGEGGCTIYIIFFSLL